MLKGKKIVTVIPAYNVAEQINATIEGIPDYVDTIIVVDDCSHDGTKGIIAKISDDRVVLVEHTKNQGVGGATIAGFKKGLELGGDIFVKMDGDDQMDPAKMEELLVPLFDEGVDYTKGNRFLHSDELKQMPSTRLVGNFVLTFFTKMASGYWKIFDPQNGYVAINRVTLEKMPLDNVYKRYFFENDMLINLNILGAKVKDVNIPSKYGDERSSLKIGKIILTFPPLLFGRFFMRVYNKYILRDFSELGFFYFCGFGLMLTGSLFGLCHWLISIYTGIVATTGTVMLAVLPIILGFQIFLQGIVLEIDENK